MSKTKKSYVAITDHAIVRYFERVLKIDMDEIKKQIIPESATKAICDFGFLNGSYPVDNKIGKYKLVIQDKTVVTITLK